MAISKDAKRIRLFGGNNYQYKLTTWLKLGHALKGNIQDETDSSEVVFTDGGSVEIDGKRKVKASITLAQTSKEELELLDDLRGSTFPLYIYNGIVNQKHQEIYFPEVNMIPKANLETPGTPMSIVLEFSALPQSANVSATPSTDFPTDAKATGSSPVTGKNPYYLIIETAVA